MVVLVTGAGGQLGQALKSASGKHAEIDFVFCNSAELNISDIEQCDAVFTRYKPDYCINAAAYTAVDKAESEPEKAFLINAEGAGNVAKSCQKYDCVLLHISTDFVFDGQKKSPYTEEDTTNPNGVYGKSKLRGEEETAAFCTKNFIIRTSWVYSEFGNNFMKTMLKLASERDSISVVDDQIGTPTNANDLADALLTVIKFSSENPENAAYGIYNFSNEGQCSWFDFAKKIFEIRKIEIDLRAIPASAYPTPAERPSFSVLDKAKIKDSFGMKINRWEESLTKILNP